MSYTYLQLYLVRKSYINAESAIQCMQITQDDTKIHINHIG